MTSHLVFKVLSYLISLIIAMVRHLSTLCLYFSSYIVHYSWYPANCQGFPSKIPDCMMKCWECSHHHQDQQGPADGGVEQFGNIIVEELAEGECTDYMPSKCPLTWQWIGLPENAPDFNPLTHIWWSSHLVCQVHAKPHQLPHWLAETHWWKTLLQVWSLSGSQTTIIMLVAMD